MKSLIKNIYRAATIALFAISLASGCAKDRNSEDYERERLEKEMAEYQSAAGRYSGFLISPDRKSKVGGLEITINASMGSTGTGSAKSSARPKLGSYIKFHGVTRMEISAEDGYYDSNSHLYTTQIKVKRKDAELTISIQGRFVGGVLQGQIKAEGYDEFGGTFALAKNGQGIDALAAQSNPPAEQVFAQRSYVGEATFGPSVNKPVGLVMLKPSATAEENFLTLLVPVKPVIATFNYGNGANLEFTNATWDQRTGTLSGQMLIITDSTPKDGITLSVACKQNSSLDLDCAYSTAASGTVATMSLTTVPKPVDPSSDSSKPRDQITRIYKGLAQIDQRPGSKPYNVTLTAVYSARTRKMEIIDLLVPPAERILQVTFHVAEGGVAFLFANAKWDVGNKKLDAVQLATVGGVAAQVSLNCDEFAFYTKDDFSFDCTYLSTLKNIHVPIRFSAK